MERSVNRIFVAIAAAMVLAACGQDDPAANARAQEILRVAVTPLEASDEYTVTSTFAGRVEAPRRSQLGFELGGELVDVRVDEGDAVKAGAVLAALDQDRLDAARREAQAALDQAQAQQALATNTLERSEAAVAFNGISDQELDQARQAAATSQAAVDAAAARVRRLDLDIRKSTLRAPYDARVIARMADEGEILAAGRPVLTLQESGNREVRIGVTRDIAATLATGQLETLDVGGVQVAATLTAIVPARNPATRTVDVVYELNTDSVFPGDLARLARSRSLPESGYWLPLGALAEGSRGLWSAYVATPLPTKDADGATHALSARAVEVIHQAGDRLYVRGAIEPGELYVTSGLQRVVSGQTVRIATTELAEIDDRD